MRLSEFDFPFDPSLIADRPVEPRDQARLMMCSRRGEDITHRKITDLPDLLRPGDLVVINDTKVIPARLVGRKKRSGGRVEILLVKDLGEHTWEVLLRGQVRPEQVIVLGEHVEATVLERSSAQTTIKIQGSHPVSELIREVGTVPLPPYIRREPRESDREWYQTIFAEKEGVVAAPTAGLHLTTDLLNTFQQRGIEIAKVTLHVGPGTFLPVRVDHIHEHKIGAERVEVSEETARAVRRVKAEGGRIVAVGTTVVRSLEAAAGSDGVVRSLRGETDLFILPGYQFGVVDALLTNFHLPRSTLLMLVSAFAGLDRLRAVYREAVQAKYRFYSYGDAMLIL